MKHLKTFAIGMAIMISGSTFANSGTIVVDDKPSLSYEIEQLLRDSSLVIAEDFFGKVIFTVSAEKQIKIHSVLTKENFFREYLQQKLENKNLSGNDWLVGQTYILPVRLKFRN